MKRTLLTMLALASLSASAQRIQATQKTIDLGQVQYCRPASAVFEMKNAGKKPLKITKVDTGCGCAAPSFTEKSVPAGDKFTLTVTYDARMMGHFDKVIEIHSNASEKPFKLDLRGEVVEEVVDFIGDFPFKLGSLTADCNYIEFEDVSQGEVLQQRFHIYNPTGKAVKPQIMHLPAYLSAEVSPSRVEPSRSAEVTVTLDSRMIREYGLTQTQVYLGANPGERISESKAIGIATVLIPSFAELTPAQLQKAPRLQMSATEVNLASPDGKKKTETIELFNSGHSRLEIQNIQMFTTGLQLQLNKRNLEPGESAKLKITSDPKQLRGIKTTPRIILITNDPENGKVVIYAKTKTE